MVSEDDGTACEDHPASHFSDVTLSVYCLLSIIVHLLPSPSPEETCPREPPAKRTQTLNLHINLRQSQNYVDTQYPHLPYLQSKL